MIEYVSIMEEVAIFIGSTLLFISVAIGFVFAALYIVERGLTAIVRKHRAIHAYLEVEQLKGVINQYRVKVSELESENLDLKLRIKQITESKS